MACAALSTAERASLLTCAGEHGVRSGGPVQVMRPNETPLGDADVLARCPLFAGLDDDDILALATVAHRRTVRAGEILFLAGEPPAGLPVVLEGSIKVYVLSPVSGREVVLTVEHPFNAVAELVAFDGGSYPANAQALEDGELLWLEQDGFQRLLRQRPELVLHVVRTLGRRLRRLVGLIEQISFQEVVHRLAGDLLASAEQSLPFTLDTNAAIGARIGTVPELVSRNLSRLHQGGLVQLHGRQVVAVDRDQLRELAQGAGR